MKNETLQRMQQDEAPWRMQQDEDMKQKDET